LQQPKYLIGGNEHYWPLIFPNPERNEAPVAIFDRYRLTFFVAPGTGGGNETSQTVTLLLDREGKRTVKLKAPATIKPAELDRIQKWLAVQFIVEEGE
jgi:hypothetical protein